MAPRKILLVVDDVTLRAPLADALELGMLPLPGSHRGAKGQPAP